jgi:hypothetical protein
MLGPGVTSTKKQSWAEKNPRALFERIVQENPGTRPEVRMNMFWEAIREDPDYLQVCVQKWFVDTERAYRAEIRGTHSGGKDSNGTRATIDGIKAGLEAKLGALILMSFPTPADKVLGECTGGECLSFGGWYINVGRKVGQKKLVKDTLSEDELRDLWKKKT